MDKHTPGPWRVRPMLRHGETHGYFVAAPDVNGFAYDAEILGEDEYRGNMERWEADANLIAAAPDLKQELRSSLCPRPCNNRPDDFEAGSCFDAGECGCGVGNALAKAEGRQSTSMEGGEG